VFIWRTAEDPAPAQERSEYHRQLSVDEKSQRAFATTDGGARRFAAGRRFIGDADSNLRSHHETGVSEQLDSARQDQPASSRAPGALSFAELLLRPLQLSGSDRQ